jgi:hypothetical protein
MSFPGLDAENAQARIAAGPSAPKIPRLGHSILVGSVGFLTVSLCAFSPWALFGKWLYTHGGEGGMYAVCAVVFILLSGAVLNPLVIGPGTLVRFSALFAMAFMAYALVWCGAWFGLARPAGAAVAGIVGSVGGMTVMGLILCSAFGAPAQRGRVIMALIAANLAGYFAGGMLHSPDVAKPIAAALGLGTDKRAVGSVAALLWGVAYGLGTGAGLGYAIYTCQENLRRRLKSGG